MCLQHPFKYLKIKPVLPALMPDYTLLLCTPRDRQEQLAVPFGTILYLLLRKEAAGIGHTLHSFLCPSLSGKCFSRAMLECSSAASWHFLPWCCPGVVQDPQKLQEKKNPSFALSYSGTRGTCLSQGGPVNLCCAPELFLWSLAVMDNLIYCVQPNRTMENGFKFKKA